MGMEFKKTNEVGIGRSWLQIRRDFQGKEVKIEINDYILMSFNEFLAWGNFISDEKPLKKKSGIIKVHVVEIKDGNKLIIEAGGIKKEIDADLFFNYKK